MSDLPWPRKGDVLFGVGTDWYNNACLNFSSGTDNMNAYADGYRLGAEVLARCVIEQERHQDILVYPIVYLWRHYTELRLKRLLSASNILLDDTPSNEFHHKILPLWQKLRPLIEEIEPDGDRETLDAVTEIFTQLDTVDPFSVSFRYPTLKDGAPSISDEIQHINIRNVAEVMGRVATFLEAVNDQWREYSSYKREMERDMQRYVR